MRYTTFNVGDIVSRKSHNNDMKFKIIDIKNDLFILKGIDYRLYADAYYDGLSLETEDKYDDKEIIERSLKSIDINRDEYFYLPGSILHIDGDQEYLDRCMKFYKIMGVKANGLTLKENNVSKEITNLLEIYHPDIVVITGHDAYYSKKKNNSNEYQNSNNFVLAIKEARKYERNQDKLIIIAGACQSDYENLIRAGANFASSPKRINIHALDPAIVASSLALSDRNQSIDLLNVISKTKYGSDGIGGIITNGTMYVGFPR